MGERRSPPVASSRYAVRRYPSCSSSRWISASSRSISCLCLDENRVTMRACAVSASSRSRSADTFAASDGGGKTLRISTDGTSSSSYQFGARLASGGFLTRVRKRPARRRDWWESHADARELPLTRCPTSIRDPATRWGFPDSSGNVRRVGLLIKRACKPRSKSRSVTFRRLRRCRIYCASKRAGSSGSAKT